jgi:uncharacterized protein YjiS (DUF1127 family)
MSISTFLDETRHYGIAGRLRRRLAAAGDNRRRAREFASLETFNDHLLRDIGIHREPHGHWRHLMRF